LWGLVDNGFVTWWVGSMVMSWGNWLYSVLLSSGCMIIVCIDLVLCCSVSFVGGLSSRAEDGVWEYWLC
jgi:hypothetical protein